MVSQRTWLFIGCLILMASTVRAMIYDNRFWPLYPQRFFAYQAYPCARWYFSARGVLIGANSSFLEDDDEVDLFEIFGPYDERALEVAAGQAGLLNNGSLLRPELVNTGELIWKQPGKISTRGVALETEIYLENHLSLGGSWYVGDRQAYAQQILVMPEPSPGPGDRAEIRHANQALQEKLKATSLCESSAVFGDIDLYLRGRITADYWMKIHHLDVGVRCGVWMPSGTRGSLYNPVSLPIGGDGHWGLYAQLDGMFLLNDCISAGFSLNVSKRLQKTGLHRLPLHKEPLPYGALIACATVSPGVTITCNPYVQFGGIREGLGLMGGYFLVHHTHDQWTVSDEIEKQFSPNLAAIMEQSSWGSDHFSIAAYYDFGFEKPDSPCAPIISMTVDVPWKGPVTKRVPKSHAISLRIESRI